MRCDRVQALMDRHLNEGLPPEEREPFEIHLRDCRGCQQQLESLRKLLAILRSEPSPPVPEGFVVRVMARANDRDTIVRTRRIWSAPAHSTWKKLEFSAGLAAALAAGLIVGLFMGHETWRANRQQGIASAVGPTDPIVHAGFEYLIDPGRDSLAQAYLELTTTSDR